MDSILGAINLGLVAMPVRSYQDLIPVKQARTTMDVTDPDSIAHFSPNIPKSFDAKSRVGVKRVCS